MTDAVAAIIALRAAAERRVFFNKLVAGFAADVAAGAATAGFVPVTGAWPASMQDGQRLTAFITSASDSDRYEIIRISNTLSGVLTMERGVEGTAALDWTAVDALVVADITAEALNRAAQTDEPVVFSEPVAFEAGAAFAGEVNFGGDVVFGPGVTINAAGTSASLVSTKGLSVLAPTLSLNGLSMPSSAGVVEGGLLVVRDGAVVGEPRSFYLGAFSAAPAQVGASLPAGSAYYDLSIGAMRVWVGDTWKNAHALAIGAGATFVFTLGAGDTEIDLSSADDNGATYPAVVGYFADVFKNGLLMAPDTGFGGDYILNSTTGLLTLATPATAGDTVLVRAVVAPSSLAPALAVARSLVLAPPDGVQTAFSLLIDGGAGPDIAVAPPSADDVYIYVDGVRQRPNADYTVLADVLTFASPPAADATVWGQVLIGGGS